MTPTPGRLALAAFAALALVGCAGRRPVPAGPRPRLELKAEPASPASLQPGEILTVSARAVPRTALAWISGTVSILGAPVEPFTRGPGGDWTFRTMVPPMLSVPPGTYHIKAWGRTRTGERVRGALTYQVE